MDLVEVNRKNGVTIGNTSDENTIPEDYQVLEINDNIVFENLTDLHIGNSLTMTNEQLKTIFINHRNITGIKVTNCPNISEEFFHQVAHHEMILSETRHFHWKTLNVSMHFDECPMIPENLIRSLKFDDDTIFFINQITIDDRAWLVESVIYITNSDYPRYIRDYNDDPLLFLGKFFSVIHVQKNFPLEINKIVTMIECHDTPKSKWMSKRQYDSLAYFYTAMKWHQPKRYFQTDPVIHPDTIKFLSQIAQVTNFYQYINIFDFISFENAFYDYYKLFMHRNYFHFFPRYNRLFNKKHFNLYDFLVLQPNFEFTMQLEQFYELMKRFGRKIKEIIIDRGCFDYKAYNNRVIFILIIIIKKFCKRIKIIKIESLIFVNDRKVYKMRGDFYRKILLDIEYKRKLRVRFLYTNSSMNITNKFIPNELLVNLTYNFNLLQKLDLVRCSRILETQHFMLVIRLPILKVLYLNCNYRNFNDWNFLHVADTSADIYRNKLVPRLSYLQIINTKSRPYDHIHNLLRNLSHLNCHRTIELRYLELNNCNLHENDLFANYDINYLCLRDCADLNLAILKSLHGNGYNLWNLKLENCDLLSDTVLSEAVKMYKNLLWMEIKGCAISDVFIYNIVEYEMLCQKVDSLNWKDVNKIFIFKDCYISNSLVQAVYDNCAQFRTNISRTSFYFENDAVQRLMYEDELSRSSIENTMYNI